MCAALDKPEKSLLPPPAFISDYNAASLCPLPSTRITFVNVHIKVTVFLGICSNLLVILINQNAHLREQLNLLLIQGISVYLRHGCSVRPAAETTGSCLA